jgi:hypothetical protein
MFTKINRRNRIRIAAAASVASLGVAGLLAMGAGTAFAAGSPVTANLNVSTTLTLAMSTSSFTLTGGAGTTASAPGAVSYTVATNNPDGYTVQLSAGSDFTTGGATPRTIPADIASRINHWVAPGMPGGGGVTPALQLPEPGSFAIDSSDTGPTALDSVTSDWSAAIPANAPPGSFSLTLNYLAVATP